MRKIGIEIFYWLDTWVDDQIACFERAKHCGFDAVEVSFVAGPDAIDVPRMCAELQRLDLDIFCSTGLSPETDISHPDAAIRQAGIDYLKRCIEVTHEIGAPVLGGVTYAPWLYFPEGDLQPYRERSAKALYEVAQFAADKGITLTLEILNRFETFMFNTVAEGLLFLAQVNHPAIKLQLDTYHMSLEEDNPTEAIRQAGAHIGHFHCAASNRKLPGQGHLDWGAIKQALDDVNFGGTMIIECFPNPHVETGRTVNTWRPLVQDYDEEAKQAVQFLRHTVA